MIGPTIASGVILNPNIVRENIPLSHMLFLVVHSCPVVFFTILLCSYATFTNEPAKLDHKHCFNAVYKYHIMNIIF